MHLTGDCEGFLQHASGILAAPEFSPLMLASQVRANLGASLPKSLGCSLLHRVLLAGLCFKETSLAQWHC